MKTFFRTTIIDVSVKTHNTGEMELNSKYKKKWEFIPWSRLSRGRVEQSVNGKLLKGDIKGRELLKSVVASSIR